MNERQRQTFADRLKTYGTMSITQAIEVVENAGPMGYTDLAHACAAQTLAAFAKMSLQAHPGAPRDGE